MHTEQPAPPPAAVSRAALERTGFVVSVEAATEGRVRAIASRPGARFSEAEATGTPDVALDLLAWTLGVEIAPEDDGVGAEQPEGAIEGECPDCLGFGRVMVRNDTNCGVGAPCDCGAEEAEPLTPAEIDRAVAHDERRACGEAL